MGRKRTSKQPRSARALPRLRARVADNIQRYRHDIGLSQERLGARAGVSGKFIGEVERGIKSLSVDTLGRVARVLRIRPEMLLWP